MANPTSPVLLTDGERARLAAWADDSAAGPLALRARIVLACAASPPSLPGGRPVSRVAAELGLSRDTVRRWRSRFLAERLAGLRDAPRPGTPRTITDEQVARVIARALEAPPAGRGRWSTRLMAAETGMSQSAVSRIWRQAGLSGRARGGRKPGHLGDPAAAVRPGATATRPPGTGTPAAPGTGAGSISPGPGRLDRVRIGDNVRMGEMQVGFQRRQAPQESPVSGERAAAEQASGDRALTGQASGQRALGEQTWGPRAPGEWAESGEVREDTAARESASAVRPSAGPAGDR